MYNNYGSNGPYVYFSSMYVVLQHVTSCLLYLVDSVYDINYHEQVQQVKQKSLTNSHCVQTNCAILLLEMV